MARQAGHALLTHMQASIGVASDCTDFLPQSRHRSPPATLSSPCPSLLVVIHLISAAAVVVEIHGDLLEQNPCLIHAVTLRVCNKMAPSRAVRCVGELDRDVF